MSRKRANNEGTVYKLPSGRWCAQVSIEGQRLSNSFDTQKDGLFWIRKLRGEVDDGLNFASTKICLDDYIKDWLITKKVSLERNTWVKYEQICRSYITPYLGKVKVRELGTDRIQKFYRSLLDQGIGTYTVIKVHTVLHSALQQATRIGMINRNPASYAQPPKGPENEMAVLNENQISQFLMAAKGHRWEALYHMTIATGMRQMEILGLKWTDLDWTRQTLKIERQLLRPDGNGIEFSSPKTRFGKRSIDLGGKTIEVLRNHYERQRIEQLSAGDMWIENDLIFTNQIGGPIDHSNLVRNFKQLLKYAGLPDIRFHDLRHTCGSLMLNNNVAPIVVSRRLGHSRPSITLDIYGHLIPSMQTGVADMIDDLITPVVVQLEKKDAIL